MAICAVLQAQVPSFQDDLRQRRARLMERLEPGVMVILLSAPKRTYSRDIDYRYRQDSNLYYLTGMEQDETSLVLLPGAQSYREILFTKDRNLSREHWHGKSMSREEAAALSGIQAVHLASEFETFLNAAFSGRPADILPCESEMFLAAARTGKARVFLVLDPKSGYSESEHPARLLAQRIKEQHPPVKVEDATDLLRDLRQVKTIYEQEILRQSLRLASEALLAGMRTAHPGIYEYQVTAAIEQVFMSKGAEGWAYPTVVGSGPNTTILHYSKYTRKMEEGDLLLVDTGASYRYLSGDVTRTYPVGGKFAPHQRDIYDIVLQARQAGVKAAMLGARLTDVHGAVVDVVRDGLYRLRLITDKSGDQYRTWFTHGSCHFIGIDVHDVGDDKRPLAPGMAFTIEPGVYIRPEVLEGKTQSGIGDFVATVRPAVEKYRNTGIRIEDSFLMTESGPECLSEGVPRTIEGIEALFR